jgi:hypothetical protein
MHTRMKILKIVFLDVSVPKTKKALSGGEHLRDGMRGVLLTCAVGLEHKARTEVRHSLEEFWTQLNPDDNDSDDDDDDDDDDDANDNSSKCNDFTSALESDLAQVRALGNAGDDHFSPIVVRTGGVGFLRCSDDAIDLVPFVRDLMLAAKLRPSTRFTNMLIPVQRVCRAEIDAVVEAVTPLIAAAFNGADAPVQRWALVWKTHNHVGLPAKADAAKRIAPLVDARHRVDLSKPDTVVAMHAVEAFAFVAVLPNYQELREYFLSRLVADAAKTTTKSD